MKVECRNLGVMEYTTCLELQRQLFDAMLQRKGTRDDFAGYVLLVEHPPVYTLGKSGKQENMLLDPRRLAELGAQLHRTDRGGDITFHGEGQLVVYPILDLERLGIGLKKYIGALEDAVIRTVAHYGVDAERIEGASGVWLNPAGGFPRKVCAIGVHSSRYVTMHGLALNVTTDLKWFDYINPCGFADKGVCSMAGVTGENIPMDEVKDLVVKFLSEELNVKIYNN